MYALLIGFVLFRVANNIDRRRFDFDYSTLFTFMSALSRQTEQKSFRKLTRVNDERNTLSCCCCSCMRKLVERNYSQQSARRDVTTSTCELRTSCATSARRGRGAPRLTIVSRRQVLSTCEMPMNSGCACSFERQRRSSGKTKVEYAVRAHLT